MHSDDMKTQKVHKNLNISTCKLFGYVVGIDFNTFLFYEYIYLFTLNCENLHKKSIWKGRMVDEPS